MNNMKKYYLYICAAFIILVIMLIPQRAFATDGVYLEDAATKISASSLQKVNINFKKVVLSNNIDKSFFTNNNDGTYSAKDPYSGESWVYLAPGTYTITGQNAFTMNDESLDLKITISFSEDDEPHGKKALFQAVKDQNNGNVLIYLYSYQLDINVTYEITKHSTGQYISNDFCYGVRDPDGADYLWSGVSTSEIYYTPGTRRGGSLDFERGFKVDSQGIKIQANNLEYTDDGTIYIANNTGSSHFSFVWSTSRDASVNQFNDMLILPDLYYEPHKVNIKINMNGGHLAATHGENVSSSGNFVTMNGSDVIHRIPFGDSLPDIGLSNYNNPSYINIERKGYTAVTNEEYNTNSDGTGTTYSQYIGYAATDFATNQSTDANVTLYVNWVPKTYTIIYNGNGGTWNNTNTWQNTVSYGSSYTVENNFYERTGYIFDGWKDPSGAIWDQGWTGTWSYDNGQYGIENETLVLTAQWNPIPYTVEYNGNGGIWNSTDTWQETVNYGSAYTVRKNFFVNTGYTFDVWKDSTDVVWAENWTGTWHYINGQYGITNNTLHLRAKWDANEYGINYITNGGTLGQYAPTSAIYDSSVRISNPSKPGNTFMGWTMLNGDTSTARYGNAENSITNLWNPATKLVGTEYFKNLTPINNATVTLVANWEPIPFTIVYNGNGGTWNNTDTWQETVNYGSSYTVQNNFYSIGDGYEFDGWKDPTGVIWEEGWTGTWHYLNGQYGIENETLVLTAQWTAKKYNITYKANDGTGSDIVDTATYGEKYKVLPYDTFTRTGYYITSWNEAPDGSGTSWTIENTSNWTWNYTRDIVLYAIWSNVYTVEYRGNGGTWNNTSSWSNTVTYGDTYTVQNNFYTYPGHQFECWKDPTGVIWNEGWTGTWHYTNGQYGIENGKLVLEAQWTGSTVTVTIKKDDSNWNENNRIKVELRQNGTTKYSATASGSSVSMNPVEAGTYDIYASKNGTSLTTLVDTGVDVVVVANQSATINYYTLSLNKGIGISAVSGAGIYLKGQAANIDATVSNGYTWEGWSVISGDSPN